MANIEKQLAEKNLTEEQRKKLEEERKILEEQHAELVRQVKVQNENTEADTKVKDAQEKNTTEDTRGKKLHNDSDSKWLDSERAFQQKLMRSQMASNYAGADASRANSETTRQLRPFQVGLTKSQMYGQHWNNQRSARELPFVGLQSQANLVKTLDPGNPFNWFSRGLTHYAYFYGNKSYQRGANGKK